MYGFTKWFLVCSINCDFTVIIFFNSFLTQMEPYNIIIRSQNEKPITATKFTYPKGLEALTGTFLFFLLPYLFPHVLISIILSSDRLPANFN